MPAPSPLHVDGAAKTRFNAHAWLPCVHRPHALLTALRHVLSCSPTRQAAKMLAIAIYCAAFWSGMRRNQSRNRKELVGTCPGRLRRRRGAPCTQGQRSPAVGTGTGTGTGIERQQPCCSGTAAGTRRARNCTCCCCDLWRAGRTRTARRWPRGRPERSTAARGHATSDRGPRRAPSAARRRARRARRGPPVGNRFFAHLGHNVVVPGAITVGHEADAARVTLLQAQEWLVVHRVAAVLHHPQARRLQRRRAARPSCETEARASPRERGPRPAA
jgi:hypothetical protein